VKIAVVVPNVSMPDEALAERRAYLESLARPGTEILVHRNAEGPEAIESEHEREWAAANIARALPALRDAGAHALIPWCANDPGVIACRELSPLPVVGPMQAACHFAALLGFRFSWLMPLGNPALVRAQIEGLGFGPRLASLRSIGVPVLELRRDLPRSRALLAEAAARAAGEDGADACVLGCMALFGVAGEIDAPVPVVDPAAAALSLAQDLVAMGLSHAPSAYAARGGVLR
jgi:allantoin racemase